MQIVFDFPLVSCPWWHWSLLNKVTHSISSNWPERPWFLVDNPFSNLGFGSCHLFFNSLLASLPYLTPESAFGAALYLPFLLNLYENYMWSQEGLIFKPRLLQGSKACYICDLISRYWFWKWGTIDYSALYNFWLLYNIYFLVKNPIVYTLFLAHWSQSSFHIHVCFYFSSIWLTVNMLWCLLLPLILPLLFLLSLFFLSFVFRSEIKPNATFRGTMLYLSLAESSSVAPVVFYLLSISIYILHACETTTSSEPYTWPKVDPNDNSNKPATLFVFSAVVCGDWRTDIGKLHKISRFGLH